MYLGTMYVQNVPPQFPLLFDIKNYIFTKMKTIDITLAVYSLIDTNSIILYTYDAYFYDSSIILYRYDVLFLW